MTRTEQQYEQSLSEYEDAHAAIEKWCVMNVGTKEASEIIRLAHEFGNACNNLLLAKIEMEEEGKLKRFETPWDKKTAPPEGTAADEDDL